jgi:hypothetical protein
MNRNQAPRDSIAATHLWVPVDATGADFYALGARWGTQVGVLSEVHDETGHPYPEPQGTGLFDPRCLRWHRLQRETPQGDQDNRLAVQVLNDYEAEYEDVRLGDAPFGQPEFFTALNRTTREADTKGRVALPSSHRRIIDSEDDRYALALTCRSVPLGPAEVEISPDESDATGPDALPPGIAFRDAGTVGGSHGSVTTTAPSVSVGGVTFFGGAAVQAAQNALAQGGSVADAARAASAAARGLPPPPLLDVDTGTRERSPGGDSTQARPPEPDRNPGGSVPLLNHPKGYVWSEAGRIGLLGTLVSPEGAAGSYFAGREGTPIGPLPLRHDAQVSMGPDLVGRMVFVSNDAAELSEGTGRPIKGWLWADSSRANVDTELGLETVQWRPVLRVDADLPPSKPPPPWSPPPWIEPPREEEEEEDDDEEDDPDNPQPGPTGTGSGGGRRPPPGQGPGSSSGLPPGTGILVGGGAFTPIPRREPERSPEGGDPPPVSAPGSQIRDYEGPGEPCPNATSGVLVESPLGHVLTGTRPRVGGLPVIPVPGGFIEFFGHPAVTPTPEGLIVGGHESQRPVFGLPVPAKPGRGVGVDPGPAGGVPRGHEVPGDEPGRIPLGLPTPPGGGIRVDPGPDDGVPRGRRVPGDDPGRIPLGLPGRRGPGLGFEPPLGGDRGVPRGYGEALDRWQRRERARRARQDYERREQQRIDELDELEQGAREAGRSRFADRVQRARERIERRRQKREERRQRREDYKERKRREHEERRQRREDRSAERRRRRDERRQRRNRDRDARRERGRRPNRPPQGGYIIDVSDPDSEALSIGRLTESERRQLEEDRRKEEETRRRYEESARFGDWNAANYPLPFLGAPGGPTSLEDWAHLATFQLQAIQRTVNGAFAGPTYLAANLGVMHRNRPGNPPAGSRIGAHWTALPGEPHLNICRGHAPLEVISILDAPPGATVETCAGGVLEVVREHRGEGVIEDSRPLILLENARSSNAGHVRADMVSDVDRRFYVGAGSDVTGSRLRAHYLAGECGPLLEVARLDPETRGVVEQLVAIDAPSGVMGVARGLTAQGPVRLTEAPLVFVVPGEPELEFALQATAEGVLRLTSADPELPVTLEVEGHVTVRGDIAVSGKATIEGSLDPTDLQLTPQPRNPVPRTAHGLWVSDGTTPGTARGGLYFERASKRIRLDA